MNTLTAAEKKDGWKLVFDGKTTAGFRGYRADTMPTAWHVADGTLTKLVGTTDITTKQEFTDFDLKFDWKLGNGGNSGVFYRASEAEEHVYWTGPEFQLLDDANAPDGKNRLTSAGSAYGLYAAPAGIVHAADVWNSSEIIVKGKHVEHWMNGVKLLEYELQSPDWEAKVKASKFEAWPKIRPAFEGRHRHSGEHHGCAGWRCATSRFAS